MTKTLDETTGYWRAAMSAARVRDYIFACHAISRRSRDDFAAFHVADSASLAFQTAMAKRCERGAMTRATLTIAVVSAFVRVKRL